MLERGGYLRVFAIEHGLLDKVPVPVSPASGDVGRCNVCWPCVTSAAEVSSSVWSSRMVPMDVWANSLLVPKV
jgi:hypothetical protein